MRIFCLLILFATCKEQESAHINGLRRIGSALVRSSDTLPAYRMDRVSSGSNQPDYDTTKWTELSRVLPESSFDLKYATTDNFVGEQMYECARCFMRPQAAQALIRVQADLKKKGLYLIFYDCYRPQPIQQKLWDKVPDDNYVTPPWKGSMHNRGLAVDLGLVNADGHVLDMGTAFDDLSPKSHHTETNLPAAAIKNRRLLKTAMEKHGFRSIRTEWWHYSFTKIEAPLDDWVWPCADEHIPAPSLDD